MYKLVKKNQKQKSDSIIELLGYEVKVNKVSIIVYNQKLIDIFIKAKLIPEFNKIIKKILIFLEEDNDPDDATLLLDELSRLYAIYINKYERFLSLKEKEIFLKNIHVLTNELKSASRKKNIYPKSKGRIR